MSKAHGREGLGSDGWLVLRFGVHTGQVGDPVKVKGALAVAEVTVGHQTRQATNDLKLERQNLTRDGFTTPGTVCNAQASSIPKRLCN